MPETVCMAQGGWKTRSMFMRYSIIDGGDLDAAQLAMTQAFAQEKAS